MSLEVCKKLDELLVLVLVIHFRVELVHEVRPLKGVRKPLKDDLIFFITRLLIWHLISFFAFLNIAYG